MNIVGPPLGKVSMVSDIYPEWNMESFARRRDVRWLTPSGVADSTFEPITGAPTRLNASS
jgi:hypothetical protein